MRSRLWSCLAAFVAFVEAPPFAWAEPTASATVAAGEVRVAQVGHSDDWPALEAALREFLRPHGLHPRFEAQVNLSQLDDLGDGDAATPVVWIELVSAERARLVLSDARRGRYLLRDVTLSNGLDEVGREALSQVIEASLLALQGQSQALDRAQLERLLSTPTGPSSPAEAPPNEPTRAASSSAAALPTRATNLAHDSAPRAAGPSKTSSVRVAPSYLLQWTGADLGMLHGPGLSLAVQRSLGGERWLGAALAYAAHFPQRFSSSLVGVSAQSHDLWLTARFEQPIAAQLSVVTEVGPGLAWSTVTPRQVEGGLARVTSPSTSMALWLRLELGLEHRFNAFSAQLSAVTDVATHDTHYDVTLDGERTRLVAPWAVAPGVRLALAWDY